MAKFWKQAEAILKKDAFTPEDRWEAGEPHDSRSEEILRFMQHYSARFCDLEIDLPSGGDGDLGEELMYLMDEYFKVKDALEQKS